MEKCAKKAEILTWRPTKLLPCLDATAKNWEKSSNSEPPPKKGRFINRHYLGYLIHQKDKLLKKAETEKAKGESIIEAIGYAVSIQDTNFKIIYQNQLHREMLGSHAGEYCFKAYRNKDGICEGCHIASTFEDGKIHRTEQKRTTERGTLHYEITASPLIDSSGNVIAGIETVRDITERKRAEEALQLTRFTVDNVADAVYWIDSKAQIFDVNETACRMLGYAREELLNLTVFDIDPDFTADKWVNVWDALKGQGKLTLETKHRTKGGRIIPVEIMANYLSFGGKELDCAFARDISERKQAEEDLLKTQKLESLGLLAGGIAHDFNNLLQGILGYISMAKMFLDQREKSLAMLEQAENALRQSVSLTTQLLTFSKGGKPMKKQISLLPVIENAARFALSGSRSSYQLDIEPSLWQVDADEGQLGQVIQNIVLNADHAMPEGGTVVITAKNVLKPDAKHPQLTKGNYVEISVRDSGIGIPEKYLQNIFDPYFTTKEKGSGLGLATSYSIVRNHDGIIDVISELGKGTSFHIYLPAIEEEKEPKETPKLSSGVLQGKILVMDDDNLVRSLAEELIKALGHEVESAKDGMDAIEKFILAEDSGKPFDVVILDLTVKCGIGGEQTIGELREINPSVKAIVSSGYANSRAMTDYHSYGFKARLIKPYNLAELRDILNVLLSE